MRRNGKFITSDHGEPARIFYAIKDIFGGLINKPTVNQYGRLGADAFDEADLELGNTLLKALEQCFELRVIREGSNPQSGGVPTEQMARDYAQMKHWQMMLNRIYGPQQEEKSSE